MRRSGARNTSGKPSSALDARGLRASGLVTKKRKILLFLQKKKQKDFYFYAPVSVQLCSDHNPPAQTLPDALIHQPIRRGNLRLLVSYS
jgi:hypothetical protein